MRSGLLILGGVLLVLSAFAHAFAGWPPLRAALESHGCSGELIGALGAGWTFGSVSMLTFGALVLCDGIRLRRGALVSVAAAPAVGAAYVAFGATAWLLRDLNPHFLLFVLTGLLIGLPCMALRRHGAARRTEAERDPVTRA
jgi:hypothetical protein